MRKPKPERHVASHEMIAIIREEDEALAATTLAAQAMLGAAQSAAQSLVVAARARHRAATTAVLRQLRVDADATIIGVEETMLIVQPPSAAKET